MAKKFSFIIPCYNEELHIENCLQSLIDQSYPRENFEILVVDNGSQDNSGQIARKYADDVIYAEKIKVGAVRNVGAEVAKGEVLVFIDADCTLDSDWLIRAEKLISNDNNTVFGGGILLPDNPSWVERHWLLEGPEGNCLPSELIGCSIVIHSDLFEKINGFDPLMSSGEDTDFSLRARRNGSNITITRTLNVTHLGNAKTLSSHIQRQIWHSQSYKKNLLKNLKDPVFILVLLETMMPAAFLVALLTANASLLFITAATFLLTPSVLTIKRYKRARCEARNPKNIFLAYTLDFTYLSARALGFITPPYRQKKTS